jgi:hypothetical protein
LEQKKTMSRILLSEYGSDRATAYAMSNKIVSLADGYICTWIDSRRQNQWALVDRNSGQIFRSGPLGRPCLDNHCGAALVEVQGMIHAITGGHHSPFEHYLLESATADQWLHVASIDVKGTYPSVACDSKGKLHLTFRSPGDLWTLDYCRFENDQWTPVQTVITAEKSGYIYWTNGLAIGPDDCIHLVLGNTRVLSDGALYYGASHIISRDAGHTWGTCDGTFLSLPAPAGNVPLMGGDRSAERIQSLQEQRRHEEAGPRNLNYQQILLSNPVVDEGGTVHVVLHNGLTGTADLLTCNANGWTARPLTTVATGGEPGKRIHMQSSLSLGQADQLHMALMIEPADECVWGPPGTYIVRIVAKTCGAEMAVKQVVSSDQAFAQWLPALEHTNHSHLDHIPPMLYTKGVNAGGFRNNKNTVETEVYLSCP